MSARKSKSSPKADSSKSGSKGVRTNQETSQPLGILEGGMRDDLIGIALVVIGIILFVAVLIPGDAVLSSAISSGLRHGLGLGAFILPFVFVVWGASYFLKNDDAPIWRIVIGVSLIVLAIMGLLSLLNPGLVSDSPDALFSEGVLVNGGGYIGSGIAWGLMSLLGKPISCIIFIACIIAGLVLFGLSVSAPFLFIKNFIFQGSDDADYDVYDNDTDISYAGDEAYGSYDDLDSGKTKNLKKAGLESVTKLFDKDKEADEDVQTIALGTGDAFDSSDLHNASASKTTKLKKSSSKRGATVTKPSKSKKLSVVSGAMPTALEGFELPDPAILRVNGSTRNASSSELKETAALLQQTLEEFSLPAKVVGWLAGPTVTMFKVKLPSGVHLSKITNLADDIALALAASSVRIAQIPTTSLVGVEIPNKSRESVLLGDILAEAPAGPLQLAIGEDVDGNKINVDLAKMPHLLIGGTTGSGKSITLNAMIMTILMRSTPAEVRMILIDPKRVEFSLYNGIPHLFVPPVTEPKEAASALKWGVAEMERRLKLFEQVGARNIGLYNQMVQKGELDDEEGNRPDELPYIVIVIDELSDLMMIAGKEVEDSIVRISQLARAAGIHLIVATQRPSANVVTGMIKANITNRIAMTVATSVESRVILDTSGAEKLVGNGDMLYSKPEWGKPKRIQGCYVDEAEISSAVAHLKEQGTPEYHLEILHQAVAGGSGGGGNAPSTNDDSDDPLLWDAADAVVAAGLGSTSMLQRRLKVGYARAGRIMDMLESKGVVGPQDGSRARDVLIDSIEDLEALKAFEAEDREA